MPKNSLDSIRLLIFDLDGTLIDSREDLAEAINHARKLRNLTALPKNEVAQNIGFGASNLIQKTIPGLSPEEFQITRSDFREYYKSHCVDKTKLYPGVLETLSYLQPRKMAVISNKPYQFVQLILEKLDLARYFDIILGEDSHPERKPNPGPLLMVMDKLSCPVEQTAIIGDWITDIEAGKGAGITTIGCLYGIGKPEEVKSANPDYLIEEFNQLKILFPRK